MPGMVFGLRLRQSEGLLSSLPDLMGLDLPVPDHTTLSRRATTWMPSARAIARMMTTGRDNLTKSDTVTVTIIENRVPALDIARQLIARFHAKVRTKAITNLIHGWRPPKIAWSHRLPRASPGIMTQLVLRSVNRGRMARPKWFSPVSKITAKILLINSNRFRLPAMSNPVIFPV